MVVSCCRLTLTGLQEHFGSALCVSHPLEGQSGHVLIAKVEMQEAAPLYSLIHTG